MSNAFDYITVPWPNWKIVGLPLGVGGFGAVYKIERTNLTGNKEYSAMKLIRIPKDESEIRGMRDAGYSEAGIQKTLTDQKNRILKEYDFMAAMSGYPNIVQCYDYEVVQHADGLGWDIFIRMELLEPLTRIVKSESLSEAEIIKLGRDICSALIACEEKNIIHRDIKPANILKSERGNCYKLGDFGIARIMDHTTYASSAGSPLFIAPEIDLREQYGKEVDIYSLGLVLYWLVNNQRLPFEPISGDLTAEEQVKARVKRLRGETIPSPRTDNEKLRDVILKATRFDPKERYASAQEMLSALEDADKKRNPSDQSSITQKEQFINGEYSIKFERNNKDNSKGTEKADWNDEDGSVADNPDSGRGGNADGTIGEFGEKPERQLTEEEALLLALKYKKAKALMDSAKTEEDFSYAMQKLAELDGYKDSESLIRQCHDKINEFKLKGNQVKAPEQGDTSWLWILNIICIVLVVLGIKTNGSFSGYWNNSSSGELSMWIRRGIVIVTGIVDLYHLFN